MSEHVTESQDWPIRTMVRQSIARNGPEMRAKDLGSLADGIVADVVAWASATDEGARWLGAMLNAQERRQATEARRILAEAPTN